MGDPYCDPDFAASALITIDVQRDVLDDGPLPIAGTTAALPRIARLVAAFRDAGRPIVHLARLYRSDGSNVDVCRRAAVEAGARLVALGSPGSEPPPGLMPDDWPGLDAERLLGGGIQHAGPVEVVIYKPRWGAFFETPLERHLREAGVTTLVFCGANFPNCPRTSIYEASERDFRVVAATDAISGIYERGVRELEGIGVRALATDAIAAALLAAAPVRG